MSDETKAQQAPPNPERKTLDDRNKMSDLERLRHSCAHVMAHAIVKLWPAAQFASGPAVENDYYYDVELEHRISPEDFPKIESEMKAIVKANQPFEKIVVTREQALADARKGRLAALGDRPAPSKFKIGNLQDIPEGEPISYYRNGDFMDLCAGPHVLRTGNIGAFKLTTVASAYYKGDEKNPQLQRIYGTAFKNKTALDEYFKMLEEAKRRDHRKIGAEMGLFCLDPEYTGRACRCGSPKARCSSRNWRSWPRKPNSPLATFASVRRISPRRRCIKPPAICPITRRACFRRWNLRKRVPHPTPRWNATTSRR
jgi:threonyl-tRNA synthetase